MLTPNQPRTTRPLARRLSATLRAMLAGTAKPMPIETPLLVVMALLTPMTSPLRFTSGPPLLPGLMAASVWIRLP
jgi:hypothetical protein